MGLLPFHISPGCVYSWYQMLLYNVCEVKYIGCAKACDLCAKNQQGMIVFACVATKNMLPRIVQELDTLLCMTRAHALHMLFHT